MIDEKTDTVLKDLGLAIAHFTEVSELGTATIELKVCDKVYDATVGVVVPCPHCGDTVYVNAKFCPECGHDMLEAEE